MIDKDTVLAILDEEYSKCLDDMNDIDNGILCYTLLLRI